MIRSVLKFAKLDRLFGIYIKLFHFTRSLSSHNFFTVLSMILFVGSIHQCSRSLIYQANWDSKRPFSRQEYIKERHPPLCSPVLFNICPSAVIGSLLILKEHGDIFLSRSHSPIRLYNLADYLRNGK